jgi:hypothetical protein
MSDGDFDTFLSCIQSPALLDVAQQWSKARGKKRMPSWTNLPSSELSSYARMLWGFAYDPKTGDFTGRLAGKRLRPWIGENFFGGRLQDLHSPANYGGAQQLLTKTVTTPAALRTSGCLFRVDGFAVGGERIVLPLAEDGEVGDGVLGASAYTPPPLLGTVEMVYDKVEWYAI